MADRLDRAADAERVADLRMRLGSMLARMRRAWPWSGERMSTVNTTLPA
jgi:hypothetical protein